MTTQIKSILYASVSLCLLWSLTIPVWHFPDEQAHFAEVQDYAEVKTVPHGNDLSLEIFESERLLGTLRDDRGRNQYTPNPGFQLPLSDTRWGYQENYLSNLDPSTRKIFVKQEAPHYAPLYYILGAFLYQQVIYGDIFTRVFITRLVSVVCFGALLFASWLLSKELFPKNKSLQLAMLAAIGFQPMLMFVGAGVNNDILMNAICTFLIAKSVAILNRKFTIKDLVHIGILVIAGILTKQLVYLLFPMVLLALLISWWRFSRDWKLIISVLGTFVGGIVAYLLAKQFNQGFWLPYWPTLTVSSSDLWQKFLLVIIKSYRETLPWYWGVYRWLGLVMPLWLLRLIKVLMGFSLVGCCVALYKWRKQLTSHDLLPWYWLIAANLLYLTALVLWEAVHFANHGFGHGLQGRYFFPLIATHIALLVTGWWHLGGKKLSKYFPALVIFIFCLFNIFSLWYVLGAYYQRLPLSLFMTQLSQYKPDFAKWPNLLIPGLVALFSLGYMTKEITAWIRSTKRS